MITVNENWKYIEEHIEEFPEYKPSIFEQGFVMSNCRCNIENKFPFFENWREVEICGNVFLYVHVNQKVFWVEKDGYVYFLIGHAYDPFEYEWDENRILQRFAEITNGDFQKGIELIYDWTGLFVFGVIHNEALTFCGDFESMRTAYYGKVSDSRWYIASHEEIVALSENLHHNQYVEKLEKYRRYRLYGEGLPGDVSHYCELRKLMCNTYVEYDGTNFRVQRLYPTGNLKMCESDADYQLNVKEAADIMARSVELSLKKWRNVAVSVTGGRDSKGTLAAAYHLKNELQFFSYNSQLAEKVDCDAAKKICEGLGLRHTIYEIPLDKEIYPEYNLVKAILHVNSNRKYFNHNDIMKRIFFKKTKPFDMELKSWTSEIGRAFCYKRYGVKRLQKKCTARRVNAINNIYLFNPILMYKTDAVYGEYLKRTQYNEHMFNYDWSDIIILEMRDSRWGADVLSCEHMFSYDVSVPYNNRHLGDILLSPKLSDRIADRMHIDFTDILCPAINQMNVCVKDYAHNNKRMWMDKIYYFITSIRPL